MRCYRSHIDGSKVVLKEPSDPVEEEGLRVEAEWLARAAHPGVARLVPAQEPGRLATCDAGARSLADLELLDPPVAAGLGAAVATVLADLHDIGIAHGSVSADHIVLSDSGRPTLCSLGNACEAAAVDPGEEMSAAARADVNALASTLLDRLDPGAGRRLRMLLHNCATAEHPPTARLLAARLAACERGARLPGLEPPAQRHPAVTVAGERGGWSGSGRAGAAAAGLALISAVVGLMTVAGSSRPAIGARARGSHQGKCAAARCAPRPGAIPVPAVVGKGTVADKGMIVDHAGRRFRMVAPPGSVVEVARWGCGSSLPVLLDVATGQLWVFGRWAPPGGSSTAVAIGGGSGARSLATAEGPGGCPVLVVSGTTGTRVLDPRSALAAVATGPGAP